MLATFRVALHYVRFDNYHVFYVDAMLWLNSNSLRWNLTRDLSRRFCVVKSLRSWNRNYSI